jgi:predicted amidohydrolase YtcJ
MATHAFTGGTIVSMDPSLPRPEAVVVRDGRVAAVGERALLDTCSADERHDLEGRLLLPGLIDAHHHLSIAALHPCWADLSRVRTLDELGDALRVQAARFPEAEWVRGAGWDEQRCGMMPTRSDLDELGLGRPVVVACYTLHRCVVDSRALDTLEIGRATPDPPAGAIARDEHGEPSGLLVERAWSEAHRLSMRAYCDPDRWSEHVAAYARTLVAQGITCIHEAACSPEAESLLASMRARLPLSVLVMPHPAAILSDLSKDRLDGPLTGEGDEALRVGPLKLFADGGVAPAISARIEGRPLELGMRFPGLREQVLAAVERGFRVAVHAIGNGGLAEALGAFGEAARRFPGRDHRFRVEHATHASGDQIAQLRDLGGVAVVQPGFLDHMGRMVEGTKLGDAEWLPFGDIARSGVAFAGSSDAPCTFADPLRGAWHGLTRLTGNGNVLDARQSVPMEDWLRAYTSGAAHAGGQEAERGSITEGKRADLVVLEGDLSSERPPRVVETWVGGELAFESAAGHG